MFRVAELVNLIGDRGLMGLGLGSVFFEVLVDLRVTRTCNILHIRQTVDVCCSGSLIHRKVRADTEHRLFEHWTTAAKRLRHDTGAITVLVSHRFSTVRMADYIIVLDHGRITETGNHDQLLTHGGLYAELFNIQARSYR